MLFDKGPVTWSYEIERHFIAEKMGWTYEDIDKMSYRDLLIIRGIESGRKLAKQAGWKG